MLLYYCHCCCYYYFIIIIVVNKLFHHIIIIIIIIIIKSFDINGELLLSGFNEKLAVSFRFSTEIGVSNPNMQEWSSDLCGCTCTEDVVKLCASKKQGLNHNTCSCVDVEALSRNSEGKLCRCFKGNISGEHSLECNYAVL